MKFRSTLLFTVFTIKFALSQQRIEVSINSNQPTQLEASAGEDVTSSG